jgi:hypothetical protein
MFSDEGRDGDGSRLRDERSVLDELAQSRIRTNADVDTGEFEEKPLTWSIVTCPKPFDSSSVLQTLAITSWTKLKTKPQITLVVADDTRKDPGLWDFAEKNGMKVHAVKTNARGLPLVRFQLIQYREDWRAS